MATACSKCGAEVPPGFRFCGACGEPLAEASPEEAPTTEIQGERRLVTVLFGDLVGFSTLAEHLDPEDLRQLITETFAELTEEVEAREGRVDTFIGDAVMAVFGAPKAHEDDPLRAVETAFGMLEAVRRRSEAKPSPLELRIGVNSGLVVSGAVGDGSQTGVLGDAVNVAARLQQAADPGQVLVSESVWRRVRHQYDAERIGLLEFKGREEPVETYRITGPGRGAGRRLAPFVGRSDERALLDLLWSSVEKGNTHLVSLIGEPGVGKSRFLAEFPIREDALDVRITCGSDRAFGPFLDLVARILGRMPSDLSDLREQASTLGVEEETIQLLAALLGLAGGPPVVRMADEQQKRQVFAGVWQFLLTAPGDRPTLVVLDDVHWVDRSSLDLLGFLLERLGGVPLMLVLAYRPGFEQVERTALRASHTAIRLEPLAPEESVALARGFLGVSALPSDLEQLVASRAEGNPFFIEELLQALLELGSLAIVDGNAVLAKVEAEIPDTVQGAILARVDRLGTAERSLLQQAAVIGQSFSTDLIQTLVGDEDLGPALEELGRAQLLVAQGPGQWTFKHGLIQEVVYETLLMRQRRELHGKVAEGLEARAGEDPELLELLAEHYAQAEVSEKAREYAMAAGDLASERMGFVEAKARYETALRLWGEGDEEGRLTLLMKFGRVAHMAGDATAARTALIEAEAGWRALGDMQRAGAALASLGRVYWMTAEMDRAAEVLDRAIELLEPEGLSAELVQAFVWASTLSMLIGHIDEGSALASRGLRMAEQLGLEGARSHLVNTLGSCEAFRGDSAGIERIRLALELAERSGEAEAIGRAYVNLPSTLGSFSLNREGVALCRRGREVMRKLGAPGFEWFIAANEASMLAELGQYEDAEDLSREMLTSQRSVLGAAGIVSAGKGLALVLVRRGRYEEARELMDELLPLARRIGGGEYLAPALVEEAELEEARGNVAAARQAVAEAVQIVLDTPSVEHWFHTLVSAVRLLPEEQSVDLFQRVRELARHPSQEAILTEAKALLRDDPEMSQTAADLYASLELPYQEARCQLEAGDLDRAAKIIKRLGLEEGPLGARMRVLADAQE